MTIGDNNVFREHVTVNRATKPEAATVIGSNNFIMAGAHIGHNCVVGSHVIIANGAMLGGHVAVQDRAFISGSLPRASVHAASARWRIMQGGAGISKDLPPFTVARGVNGICGLNVVGLRRAGFSAAERLELKKLYHALFRSGKIFTEAVAEARKEFSSPGAKMMLEFIATAKRGVCADGGAAGGEAEE